MPETYKYKGMEGLWALPRAAHDWIQITVPPPATILELGSGGGSARLVSLGYVVYSVEHKPEWVMKFPEVEYLYAPIGEDGWYDEAVLAPKLRGLKYDLVIFDGPGTAAGRGAVTPHLHLFDLSVPLVVDDVDSAPEMFAAVAIAKATGRQLDIHAVPESTRKFATLTRPQIKAGGWESL